MFCISPLNYFAISMFGCSKLLFSGVHFQITNDLSQSRYSLRTIKTKIETIESYSLTTNTIGMGGTELLLTFDMQIICCLSLDNLLI